MTSSRAVNCVKSECISKVLVAAVLHHPGWVWCNHTGCPGNYCTHDLFICLIHCIRILRYYMTWQPCNSEYVLKPWASIHGHVFSLLVVCCGTLTVADIGSYSIEEHLVARVLVHKKTAWVRWRIRWWHGYRNDLGSHLPTKWFFYHGENMGMWKILLGAVSQYSEQ
jgi:hypothetical protein